MTGAALLLTALLPLASAPTVQTAPTVPTAERIVVDAQAPTTPFPHFWERTFGSGRAILALRESYRQDLRTVKKATDFESVRFHGIFLDEVGLYDPDRQVHNPGLAAQAANDASVYNFSYIDQIYDGLLENHVRPFVELSFMPKKLAADPAALHAFWYRPNVSPPRDYKAWDRMIAAFAAHLVDRYGIDEVAAWEFEVWNEPNLDFWGGNPKQATYFELYDHTARALKAVSPRLRVGGPATAQAAWVAPFLAHAKAANVPVDFVSTHVYANDTAADVLGIKDAVPRETMVYRAVKKVHDEIVASSYPQLPLIFSEYNASYANEPNVTDATYMGPWLANNIRLCDGLTQSMAYWTFSDVFEEQGVVRSPFYGGFGLIAAEHIAKPALNVFAILHKLGDRRIALASESALATKTRSGAIVLALYDYAPPTGTGDKYTMPTAPAAPAKVFTVHFKNTAASASVRVFRVDGDHGNVLAAFDAMGRPAGALPPVQLAKLRRAGQLSAPEHLRLNHGDLELTVPAHGLAVVVLGK